MAALYYDISINIVPSIIIVIVIIKISHCTNIICYAAMTLLPESVCQ